MRAPIFIDLAIWYYTTPMQHPSIEMKAPAYIETAHEMVKLGMLQFTNMAANTFKPTDGLNVYVEALCKVPTPVQRWVIPDEE